MDLIEPDRLSYKLSQSRRLRSVCVWLCQITSPHDKPNRGCIFLPSQLYAGRHGESHGNAWAATGYFVCTRAHSAWWWHTLVWRSPGLWCVNTQGRTGFNFPGSSRRLQALFRAHRCSFQLEGIYWWHVPAWNNAEAAVSGYEGREEPHLEIWQRHSGWEQT